MERLIPKMFSGGRFDELIRNYAKNSLSQTSSSNRFNISFSSIPCRILDAPGVVDDFYLNNLDWSVKDVVAIGLSNSVYLWNSQNNIVSELMRIDHSLEPHQGFNLSDYISSVSWSYDGCSISIGTSLGSCHIWDAEMSRRIRTFYSDEHSNRIVNSSWAKHIIAFGSSSCVSIHDIRQAKSLVTKFSVSSEPCGLQWSFYDSHMLAVGQADGRLCVYHLQSKFSDQKACIEFPRHSAAVKALAWCPWKRSLLASGGGSADRMIKLWDVKSDNIITQPVANIDAGGQLSSILWSKDKPYQFAASVMLPFSGPSISLYGYVDCNNRAINQSISSKFCKIDSIQSAHQSRILKMCISPDGRQLASLSGGQDETLKFWSCWEKHQQSPQIQKKKHKDDGFKYGRSRKFRSLILPIAANTRARNIRDM